MYNVLGEWNLRKVELSSGILSSKRSLLRWLALSLGLLDKNDRREGVLDVLDALFSWWFGRREDPTFEDIKYYVSRRYLERGKRPPSDEALRYHLRRLIRMGLVARRNKRYRLRTSPHKPEDVRSAIDSMFEEVEKVRELLKEGISHLKNLYG